MNAFHFCKRIVARIRIRTRYARALEDEIVRLRTENRALVNSILGVAGMPPLRREGVTARLGLHGAPKVESTPADAGAPVLQNPTLRRKGSGWGTGAARLPDTDVGMQRARKTGPAETGIFDEGAAPLRRRSWQQIGRLREIEDARAARRERETDTETFPTPSQVVPRV